MRKKILSFLTMLWMVIALLPVNMITVSAYTGTKYGDYLYYQIESNGEVTITDCDESATKVEIPSEINGKKVTSIDRNAFSYCRSLTSVIIPNSITSIGFDAFIGCTNLKKVNITDIDAWCKINFVTSESNPLCYAKKLYMNNKVVTNAVITNAVIAISDYVFYGCSSLTSVTIPDSVTNIGMGAFGLCTGITSITIPNSVTNIGRGAFRGCSSLTSVTIPNSVTSIGVSAFEVCSDLKKVNITNIDAWCKISFGDVASNPLWCAKNLYMNDRIVTSVAIPNSVTSIGDYTFSGCSSLTSLLIPNSVTSIGDDAFRGCIGLTNITIPDSVTTIGDDAFYKCTGLTSITIPDSVTSIGSSAFKNCSSLTSVTIGNSVTSIEEYVFSSCNNLTDIVIPNTVTEINQNSFSDCNVLSLIFYTSSEDEWGEIYVALGNDAVNSATKIYNVVRKTYRFETNGGTELADVTDYVLFSAPQVENGDKTLIGWYDNAALSGSPVTFPYYGDATTLYAAWTDRTGTSFDDAFIAKANEEYSVTLSESGQLVYYEFVPRLTGEYRFYSKGSLDTCGYLYDSNKKRLTSDDDSGDGRNFKMTYTLTAGETYYIAAELYSGTGSFTLVTETDCIEGTKTVCVTATTGEKIFITIPNYLPENASVILACYKNNALTEVMTAPNKNETLYFITKKDFDSAKVMVWNNLKSMTPLCGVEIVSN